MQLMHGLAGFDANLVRVLDTLLEERHVIRAARRLHLSPSATSHALARLRAAFHDPLLVRVGRSLTLTSRAEELRDPAAEIVKRMGSLLEPREPFRPERFLGSFTIATSDHVRFVLMKLLDQSLRDVAPKLDLHYLSFGPRSFEEMRDGSTDLCIGMFDPMPPDLRFRKLFEDRLVCVCREDHPVASGAAVSMRSFAKQSHVLVAPTAARRGMIDSLLEKRGLSRRIACTLPTFLDALHFVAASDHLTTMPERIVAPLLRSLRLRTLRVKLPLPTFRIVLVWHPRTDAEPAHAWFREELARCAGALSPLAVAPRSLDSVLQAARSRR